VVALTRIEAQKRRVQMDTQLSEGLPVVCCASVQLQQVILNLVMNALEAMEAAPRRLLRIASGLSKPGVVRVSVADSGPGIAATDVFFFKQKTVYEIGQWLEFRRVLFR